MSTISFRGDAEIDAALAELAGPNPSKGDQSRVLRESVLLAARLHRAQRLREEAQELAADPVDRDEAHRVLTDMEALRAW